MPWHHISRRCSDLIFTFSEPLKPSKKRGNPGKIPNQDAIKIRRLCSGCASFGHSRAIPLTVSVVNPGNTKIGSLQTSEAWLACALVWRGAVAGKLGGCFLDRPVAARIRLHCRVDEHPRAHGTHRHQHQPRFKPSHASTIFDASHHGMLTTTLCGLLFRWWPPVELRETSRDNARSIVAAQS